MTINVLDSKWKVNGTPLYAPAKQPKIQHSNITSSASGRLEDGTMYIDWLRTDVRKVNLTWAVMTQSELNYTMSLLQGKEFSFTFPDRGITQTMDAYAGESSYTMYTENYKGTGEALYTDVSINIIEK